MLFSKLKNHVPLSAINTDLIIEGCRKQEKNAQKTLYYNYYSVLMNLCMRYSKDKGEAEQLVHDGFLKIFDEIDSYKHEGSFDGWMRRICVNTCLDNVKKRKTFAGLLEMATVYDERIDNYDRDYVTNDVFKKFSVDAVLALVEKLPEKEKLVFKLYVFDGYTHEEIGSIVGIKTNHCYWLLHNARKLLKTIINKTAETI